MHYYLYHYISNHITIYQNNLLYTLNLHNVIHQIYSILKKNSGAESNSELDHPAWKLLVEEGCMPEGRQKED